MCVCVCVHKAMSAAGARDHNAGQLSCTPDWVHEAAAASSREKEGRWDIAFVPHLENTPPSEEHGASLLEERHRGLRLVPGSKQEYMSSKGTEGLGSVSSLLLPEELFRPLLSENPEQRARVAKEMAALLLQPQEKTGLPLMYQYLPTIHRFACGCPFEEIRQEFRPLLEAAQSDLGFRLPRHLGTFSYFLPYGFPPPVLLEGTSPPPNFTGSSHAQRLAEEAFLETSRVPNLARCMLYHPTFFECFVKTDNQLMKDERGPLPLCWRNFLAILAASRHNCEYIIKYQEQEFLYHDGPEEWLSGDLSVLPKKLQDICRLNALLAHQPWRIRSTDIEILIRGSPQSPSSSGGPPQVWSIAELVQAMIILAHTHSMCSIVYGCGVVPESDLSINMLLHKALQYQTQESGFAADWDTVLFDFDGEPDAPSSGRSEDSDSKQDTETTALLEKLMVEDRSDDSEEVDSSPEDGSFDPLRTAAERGAASLAESTEEEEEMGDEEDDEGAVSVSKYLGPFELSYEDFDIKSHPLFRVVDFSWGEEAFSLCERYYAEVADLLDTEFNEVYVMTDHKFNSVEVNTAPFRQAIWYYVQRLYGIQHDDYHYSQVNNYTNRQCKSFVKNLAALPERLTRQDFLNSSVGYSLRPEEKFHIAILAAESRKQSEIMYGLHAISQYLSRN